MGTLSPVHWLLVALVVLLLFGPRRLAAAGRDLGAGLRSFKKSVSEEEGAAEVARAPDAARSTARSEGAASN